MIMAKMGATKIIDTSGLSIVGLTDVQKHILTISNPYNKLASFEDVYIGKYSIELTYSIVMTSASVNIYAIEVSLEGFEIGSTTYQFAADNCKVNIAVLKSNRALINGLSKQNVGDIKVGIKLKKSDSEYYLNTDVDTKNSRVGIWLIPIS